MTCIRIVETPQELEAVYRFRYQVYVEEMRRPQKDADHVARRIEDALDGTAINLAAWEDGAVVGIARVNLARYGNLGMYEDFYAMTTAGADHPRYTSIITRLMVAPERRRTVLTLRLMLELYRFGLAHEVRWNFIDCNDHLVEFFRRAGFVQHLPMALHDEYGQVTCMRLNLLDEVHLARVGSPFVGALRAMRTQRAPHPVTTLALDY